MCLYGLGFFACQDDGCKTLLGEQGLIAPVVEQFAGNVWEVRRAAAFALDKLTHQHSRNLEVLLEARSHGRIYLVESLLAVMRQDPAAIQIRNCALGLLV